MRDEELGVSPGVWEVVTHKLSRAGRVEGRKTLDPKAAHGNLLVEVPLSWARKAEEDQGRGKTMRESSVPGSEPPGVKECGGPSMMGGSWLTWALYLHL